LSSAYSVASAKPDILGATEPSTTTPGGELKGPDKHELSNQNRTKNNHSNNRQFSLITENG
jgi:hypothetical protein